MAKILVFTETSGDNVKNVTLEILGKLSGQDVDVAAIGDIGDEGTKALAAHGAANVHKIKGDKLDQYSPEGYSNASKRIYFCWWI
jgi:electron transfer flavoprotein alpha subunit